MPEASLAVALGLAEQDESEHYGEKWEKQYGEKQFNDQWQNKAAAKSGKSQKGQYFKDALSHMAQIAEGAEVVPDKVASATADMVEANALTGTTSEDEVMAAVQDSAGSMFQSLVQVAATTDTKAEEPAPLTADELLDRKMDEIADHAMQQSEEGATKQDDLGNEDNTLFSEVLQRPF